MGDQGYDPTKSRVSDEKMDQWRASTVSGDLTEVPGIGPKTIEALRAEAGDSITNTYQLFGHYLKLRGPDDGDREVSVIETNHKMWYWLKSKGIKSHRSAIVKALNEKTSTFFSGFQNADDDGSDDE